MSILSPSNTNFTLRVARPTIDAVKDNATCIFACVGTEPRAHVPLWDEVRVLRPQSCVEILVQEERKIYVRTAEGETEILLTDEQHLLKLLRTECVYIDISGLAHQVWAPLLKLAFSRSSELIVLYVEPGTYRAHPSPASTSLFDLSDGFGGIGPLPGFANLLGPQSEREAIFVPFLGFEGTRSRFLAMSLDPIPKVIPIIGVPGFRLEYPQVTVASNQEFLHENRAHADIRFARASCPFDAYSTLVEIRRDNPDAYLYLAPIGTKPHALGAIWYAIDHPDDTEIMYDHPLRKPKRTAGVSLSHFYYLKTKHADI